MKRLSIALIGMCTLLSAQSAQQIIEQKGCLGCHAVAMKKNAPAFTGIAKRNLRFEGENAKAVIMQSIKNGSKGKYPKFSNAIMPAYPDMSVGELNTVAEYILSQASKAKRGGGGAQGRGMQRGSF